MCRSAGGRSATRQAPRCYAILCSATFPTPATFHRSGSRLSKLHHCYSRNDKFRDAEPLMVGEGKDGYSVYLSQARVGQGRLLRACGLDVLTDTPERANLLDAMLDYVRSDAFAPRAMLPASF